MGNNLPFNNLIKGIVLTIILIVGLFLGIRYFSNTRVPSSYNECVIFNYGKKNGFDCSWKFGVPSKQSCNEFGCWETLRFNFNFIDCAKKGGIITKLATKEDQMYCSLTYFDNSYKVPDNFEECQKTINSVTSGYNLNRVCQITYTDSAAFDSSDNNQRIEDIIKSCQEKGGQVINNEYSTLILDSTDLSENSGITLKEAEIKVKGCKLLFPYYKPPSPAAN